MQLIRELYHRGIKRALASSSLEVQEYVGLAALSSYVVTRMKEAEPGLLLRIHYCYTKEKMAVFLSVITAGTLDYVLVSGRDDAQ